MTCPGERLTPWRVRSLWGSRRSPSAPGMRRAGIRLGRAGSELCNGALLRQTCLVKTVDEMIAHGVVAQRLRRYPMTDGEMRVGDEEEFDLCMRLFGPSRLGEAGGQEAARARAVGFFSAQCLD